MSTAPFYLTRNMVKVIQANAAKDVKLKLIADMLSGTLDQEGSTLFPPQEGDMLSINVVDHRELIQVTEASVNTALANGEKLQQPIKGTALVVFVIDGENKFGAKVAVQLDAEVWKELSSLDPKTLVASVSKITFSDDSVGWSLLGPNEPRNVDKISQNILETCLGFRLS